MWTAAAALDAEPLARILAHGTLSGERATRLGLQLVGVLERAQRRGVFHGGLTDRCVVLTQPGSPAEEAAVTDFGWAGRLAPSERRAPETRDDRTAHGSAVDIWAVGELMAACVPPAHRSPELHTLIQRCTHPDPAQRPRNLAAVRRHLERPASHAPDTQPPRSAPRPGRLLAWAMVAAALGAGLSVGGATLLVEGPAQRDVARGRDALSAGDAAAAILAYESALRRMPRHTDALRGLARAQEALGMRLAAATAWERLLALSPTSADAHLGLARGLMAQRDPAEAVHHAAAAVAAAPGRAEAHRLHGEVLLAGGEIPEATAALERAAALSPSDAGLHHRLGLLLARDPMRWDQAEEALGAAVKLSPDRAAYKQDLDMLRQRVHQARP